MTLDEGERSAAVELTGFSRWTQLIGGLWLVLVINPLLFYASRWDDPAVVLAYVLMVPFVAVYLGLLLAMRSLPIERRGRLPARTAWGGIVTLLLLCLAVYPGWGQDAVNLTAFPVLAGALVLPTRQTLVFVPVWSVLAYALTVVVPDFDADINVPLVLLGAGLVMANLRQTVVRNIDLLVARAENEQLLLDQERNRFARDLHDVLGHSMTVITVKSELAGRLLDTGAVERARAEVSDVERLSREVLGEVREAVEGYRELTLPAELARARSALLAAGIDGDLPTSTDEVETDLRELFAWATREAVTNVLRHGDGGWCTVELAADRLRVRNSLDARRGAGGGVRIGNGLRGLQERAEAVGARLTVRQTPEEGFVLEVRRSS